jgi:predicted RNA-binding Zn-ribbon protein involved in translation (DUF1610 family)
MTQKQYKLGSNFNDKTFVNAIGQYINTNYNAEIQVLGPPNDAIIQIREKSVVKKLTGMSSAITIHIKVDGEKLIIEEGKAKWFNKVATAGIGALIFLPLIATAGIGVFLQDKMIKDVSNFISEYLEQNGHTLIYAYTEEQNQNTGSIEETKKSQLKCPSCNANISKDSKFCNECGTSLLKKCSKCNADNSVNSKFCKECGNTF